MRYLSYAIHPGNNRFSIRRFNTLPEAITATEAAAQAYCKRQALPCERRDLSENFVRFNVGPYGFDALREGEGWSR